MLVFFAVSLVMLMGFCGLAVDVGRIELRTLQLQAAADAGALSAADDWGRANTGWATSARTDAQAVATANGVGTVTVASQLTAGTGAYATNYAAVQTVVSQSMPTIFLGLLSSASKTVTVKATAVADPPPCMYFLGNPANSGDGFMDLASAGMYLECPVYVRGTPIIDGFAHVQNHQIKSSANLTGAAPGGGWSTYPPFYNYPVLSDPLAYVTLPSFSACTAGDTSMNVTSARTLSPGTYCGGLTITGPAAGITVTFNPGLYIITGGANFRNATLTGAGVTLFLTKGGGSGFGTMSSQNTTWNLTAPTSSTGGVVTGVTLCNDRAWVGGTEDFAFNGGVWYGDGIIYATGTGVYDWTVTMYAPNYFGIVANNLYQFGSTIQPSANYASLTGGNPYHVATSLVQ